MIRIGIIALLGAWCWEGRGAASALQDVCTSTGPNHQDNDKYDHDETYDDNYNESYNDSG